MDLVVVYRLRRLVNFLQERHAGQINHREVAMQFSKIVEKRFVLKDLNNTKLTNMHAIF
jgi:hypothetical protein